ncbi:hypothetical protein [Flavobacterium sp. KACC 22763]|nr:hypothetical protein [Flavobacterium sp. KACC 22763]WDF62798.1 hypothetical protein PQ463_14345 [Flavobacterium sp. KACC 22763]
MQIKKWLDGYRYLTPSGVVYADKKWLDGYRYLTPSGVVCAD